MGCSSCRTIIIVLTIIISSIIIISNISGVIKIFICIVITGGSSSSRINAKGYTLGVPVEGLQQFCR